MKIFGKVAVTFIFALIVVGLAGTVQSKAARDITATKKNRTYKLVVGKTYKYLLTKEDDPDSFIWKSSKAKIASVNPDTNEIVVNKKGKCTLTASNGKTKYKFTIKCVNDPKKRVSDTSFEFKKWSEIKSMPINVSGSIPGSIKLFVNSRIGGYIEISSSQDGKNKTSMLLDPYEGYWEISYSQPYSILPISGSQYFEIDELTKKADIDLNWDYLGGYSATELNNKVKKNIDNLIGEFTKWLNKTDLKFTLWDFGIGEF